MSSQQQYPYKDQYSQQQQQQQQQYDAQQMNQLTGQMNDLGFQPPRPILPGATGSSPGPGSGSGSVNGASGSRKKRPQYVVDEVLKTPRTPSVSGFPSSTHASGSVQSGSPFTPVQPSYFQQQQQPSEIPGITPPNMMMRHAQSTTSLPATTNMGFAAQQQNNYPSTLLQQQQQFQSQVLSPTALIDQHPQQQVPPQQAKQQSAISFIPETGSNQQYSPDSSLQVPLLRYEAEQEWSKLQEFRTFENVHPPMIGIQSPKFIDQGVAPPNYMRLSMYSIPMTNELLKASRLPLGLMVRPFNETATKSESDDDLTPGAELEEHQDPGQAQGQGQGEGQVPVVDLNSIGGPPRCRRCRAYVNPQMQFTNSYKMVCNMCQFASDCPTGYGAALDPSGKRIDYYQRPELYKSVVDFVVPEEYYVTEGMTPSPLNYVFLIDLSASSLNQGIHKCIGDCIRQTLYNGGECNLPPNAKICFIGFDQKLFFYNLSPSLQVPTIATVSDIQDPFIPFYEGLFVNPVESRSIIEDTLTMIESKDHFKTPEPCFGSALKAALLALESFGGGKVTSILTSLPSTGLGALKYKDPHMRNAIDREKAFLSADSPYYVQLAKDFAMSNVGLDLFVISPSSVDLANTALTCFKTGGNLRLYQNFNLDRDERKLCFDLKNTVMNDQGYQGHLKIRCSSGLQVSNYYGNFYQKENIPDPYLPILHNGQTFMCDFVLDGKLDPKLDAHFQAAILYTDRCGIRKVRVINMVCAVAQRIADVFIGADQDTVINLWMRQQLAKLPMATLQTVRNFSNLELVNTLTQYRALVAGSSVHAQQFIIPEPLKAVTMYALAFQKSRIVRGAVLNGDSKVANWHFLNSSTLEKISFNLYPLIVAIHDLEDDECLYDGDTGHFKMPHQVRASGQFIQQGGCYLAFNGEKILIWVHNQVNPLLLQDLFGSHIQQVQDINPLLDELPRLETDISKQFHNLVQFITRQFLNVEFAPTQICRVGIDGSEQEFLEMLVEDTTPDKQYTYAEYLSHIHKCVKDKVANEKPKKNNINNHNNSMNNIMGAGNQQQQGTDMSLLTQRWLH